MQRALVATLVLALVAGPALGHAGGGAVYWKRVDYYASIEGEPRKFDARLVLDPVGRELVVTDEDQPWRVTYARITYDAITSITYSKSKHPRWKAGAALLIPLSVFAIPFFFMKGKKHWLSVTFAQVSQHPDGFIYVRLDKNNYQQIIAAIEGQIGIAVDRIVED